MLPPPGSAGPACIRSNRPRSTAPTPRGGRLRWGAALVLGLLGGSLSACSGPAVDPEAEAAAAVAAAPPPTAPYVTAAPVLVIEGASYPFGFIGDAVMGRGGDIYVADFQARTIERFDATGRHVATIGQQGRGPGELEAIAALAVSGDSLFVWDPVIWRITAFDPAGTLLSTRRVEPRGQSGWPTRAMRANDGTWLYLDQEIAGLDQDGVEVEDDIIRANARLVRWSVDADAWTDVAVFPGTQAALMRSETGEPSLTTAPFPRGPLWTVDRAGGYWYADNGAYVVTRFTAAGDTLGRIVVGLEGATLTDADRRAFLTADGRLEASDPQAAIRSALPMPERRPVLVDLLTSREGDLWVGVDAGVPDSVEWHAFGADRRMRFRLRLPATAELKYVSGDTALVVTRSALDVQDVARIVVR